MGFLGMSGKTWKKVGKFALQKVAPIAANFIPGVGPLASMGIRAAIGAAGGAAGGGGWKSALMGGGLGAIPTGGAGGAASGAVKTGLGSAAKQIGKQVGTQAAGGLASKYLPGQAGSIANAAISGYGGGGIGTSLKNAAKAGGTQLAANQASRIPGIGALAGTAVGAGVGSALNGTPGATFGQNLRSAGKAALGGAQAGGVDMAGNYAMNSLLPQGGSGFGASPRPAGPAGYDFRQGAGNSLVAPPGGGRYGPEYGNWNGPAATSISQEAGQRVKAANQQAGGGSTQTGGGGQDGGGGGFGGFWEDWGGPITTGIGLGVGGYVGKKAQENAMQRSPEEMMALRGAQGVAGDAASAAKGMMGESKPWMRQAGNYYSTLLSGNRAAQAQAVAPGMAAISQQYRGAERGLDRSGVRGAARDVAAGELGRERVSKMAGLTTGVQGAAADALGNLGINMGNQAGSLYNTAGQVNTNLLAQGQANRKYAREEGGKAAEQAGKIAHDVGVAVNNSTKKKPQVATPLPKIPMGPTPTSGIPGNQIPGQQMPLPTVPTFPRAPAPTYPGGKVTPPVFGGGGTTPTPYPGGRVTPPVFGGGGTGDYNPYKAIYG